MIMDYLLANTDKFIAIFALIITSIITRYTVSLNYQTWVNTFSGSLTLLLLPIITYSITSVISGNIALSLGMIGALSIVRFRNPVRSSFELVIFFFMISLGICAAVDLRWLIILSFSCNFILCAIYFFNSLNKKFLNTDLFKKNYKDYREESWFKKGLRNFSGSDWDMEVDRFHLNDDELKSNLISLAKSI